MIMRTVFVAAILAVGLSTGFAFLPVEKRPVENIIDCSIADCKT